MSTVTPTTSSSSTAKSGAATNALSGNYELFLTLLTTQIQNQDPLDPMDSAEYTNQLVQYSSVEQAIQTNQHLETLVSAMEANRASSYVSYLGSEVTAAGSSSMLTGGEANWSYEVKENATGTFEIRNASGALVYSGDMEMTKGTGTFKWDGTTSSGTTADNGTYSITFNMKDGSGNSEPVSTQLRGVVDEVDLSSGEAFLKIGDLRIPVTSVLSVRQTT